MCPRGNWYQHIQGKVHVLRSTAQKHSRLIHQAGYTLSMVNAYIIVTYYNIQATMNYLYLVYTTMCDIIYGHVHTTYNVYLYTTPFLCNAFAVKTVQTQIIK